MIVAIIGRPTRTPSVPRSQQVWTCSRREAGGGRAVIAESRGLFVTLDGPCGVGKTTAAGLLGEHLAAAGVQVLTTTTPSQSPIGKLARHSTYEICGIPLTCLVAADRYHHAASIIEPALEDDIVVICDRHVISSLALDGLDGVDHDFVWEIYRHIIVPDIAIVLLADPEICAARTAIRGTYSRFHHTDSASASRERRMYDSVVAYLQKKDYPVLAHDIGDSDADEVARRLASVVPLTKGKEK
jgi:dTMP kinase